MNTITTTENTSSHNGFINTVRGLPLWFVLHCISMNYPPEPSETEIIHYRTWFEGLAHVLPCCDCPKNFADTLTDSKLFDQERDFFSGRLWHTSWPGCTAKWSDTPKTPNATLEMMKCVHSTTNSALRIVMETHVSLPNGPRSVPYTLQNPYPPTKEDNDSSSDSQWHDGSTGPNSQSHKIIPIHRTRYSLDWFLLTRLIENNVTTFVLFTGTTLEKGTKFKSNWKRNP
jgi:hypothetical protein